MTGNSSPNQKTNGGLPGSFLTAAVMLLIVIGYFAIGTFVGGNQAGDGETTTEVERPLFTVLVTPALASNQAMQISMSGRTEAGRSVVVRAQTSGQIASTPAPEGSQVQKDNILCLLETDSRQAIVAEARAALVKTEADYSAAKRLFDDGFSADIQVRAAKAALDGSRARLSLALQELDNIKITAPFTGLVAETLVEPGDVIAMGGPCAVLADMEKIVVVGSVSGSEARTISLGDVATVAIPDRGEFSARVRFIAEIADPRTRAFRVEVSAKNNDDLPSGLNALATIQSGSNAATRIPRNALVFNDAGDLGVRIVENRSPGKTGNVVFVPVSLIAEGSQGAFVSGLIDGMHVIVRGQDFVSHGIKVAFVLDDRGGQ